MTIAQAVSEKTFKNNMAAVMASWISDQHNLSYFRSRGHLVATVKFSTQISRWFWRMSKTGFQDDSCGSHLKFLISKVLFAFDLQVILLLQCKFSIQITKRFRSRRQNSLFNMVAVVAILDFYSIQF